MSKKIIFVGPPKAGKTTLRKIFFEGENSKRLLEFGLEPTHGQESILLKLSEDIGIFDLAGQENQRWFETSDKEVFDNTEIIIIVIDITTPIEEITDFSKKVINIRKELCASAFIYLLLHKKDLLSKEAINEINIRTIKEFREIDLIKIAFTSIQKKYFLETLELFLDILKKCTSKIVRFEKDNLDLLKNIINLLYYIHKDIIILEKDLKNKLNVPLIKINKLIKFLEEKEFIKISKSQNSTALSLTDKGKSNFENILHNFSLETLKFKINYLEPIYKKKKVPPFLGFMVADKDGKTLMIVGTDDEIFNEFFRSENEKGDTELIPIFICALEKFSSEINIQNLPGFKLKGTNLKIETFRYDLITVSLFMNSETNEKPFKDRINIWFTNFFENNKKNFEKAILMGDISNFVNLKAVGRKWLVNLNKSYIRSAIDLEIFDFKQAKKFYIKLDKISKEINSKYLINNQKIKILKKDCMYALNNEDFEEIREIAKAFKDLKF